MAREASTSGVEGAVDRWSTGLDEETAFWLRWLSERGAPWHDDFARRVDPEAPLQPHVARHVDPALDTVRILDVGSGPLTVLGKRWEERTLEITAVDPLADRFAELFERTGIHPIVAPVKGEGEHVAELFPRDSFDLVYAQNCIDHGYDPLRAIRQMLELVKPGSALLLEHAIDEGEYMQYAGPHQWNFRSEDGRFTIWRPDLRVDAHKELERLAEIEIEELTEDRWIRVALRKRQGAPGGLRRFLRRG